MSVFVCQFVSLILSFLSIFVSFRTYVMYSHVVMFHVDFYKTGSSNSERVEVGVEVEVNLDVTLDFFQYLHG